MPRFLLAATVLVALAPDRSAAFGGHFFCGPLLGRPFLPPPVVIVPFYPVPVFETIPVPCCPAADPCCPVAPLATAPITAAPLTPAPPPPRVQQVPSAQLGEPLPKIGPAAEPAPPARDVNPAGVAVPRAADPSPPGEGTSRPKPADPLQIPRPADKTSDGQPIPRTDVPTKPKPPTSPPTPAPSAPKDPDDFPPLKLNPPMEEASLRITSRFRPLTDDRRPPRVDVIPVEGKAPATGPTRTAGFFNRTDRSMTLTVSGETITLPGQHTVTARVAVNFTWKLDGGPERKTDVPAGAPGVEVVIRR